MNNEGTRENSPKIIGDVRMQNIEYFSTIGKQMDDIFTASCNLLKTSEHICRAVRHAKTLYGRKEIKKNKDKHSRNTLVQGKYAVGTNVFLLVPGGTPLQILRSVMVVWQIHQLPQ